MKKFYTLLHWAILSNLAINIANATHYEEARFTARSEIQRDNFVNNRNAVRRNPYSSESTYDIEINNRAVVNAPRAENRAIERNRERVKERTEFEEEIEKISYSISVSKTDNVEKLGYDCVSLIKYTCAIECVDSIEQKLKNRICFRDCTNERYEKNNCE